MKVFVLIRHGGTGEVRALERRENSSWRWDWTDGNYGCDCNRALFFDRAGGAEPDELLRCSEGKFLVRILDENDKVLYAEF